jgi:hypothetical protein
VRETSVFKTGFHLTSIFYVKTKFSPSSLRPRVANTRYHFVCVQIVVLVFLPSKNLRLAMEQSSVNEGGMCGRGACLSARVAATLLLNLLNQTPQSYNGRTVRKHPGGFTEPGSRADGFGATMTHIHK